MRPTETAARIKGKPAKCKTHPATGQMVYDLQADSWECSSCAQGLPDERPRQRPSEAMLRDMKRLGIEPSEEERR